MHAERGRLRGAQGDEPGRRGGAVGFQLAREHVYGVGPEPVGIEAPVAVRSLEQDHGLAARLDGSFVARIAAVRALLVAELERELAHGVEGRRGVAEVARRERLEHLEGPRVAQGDERPAVVQRGARMARSFREQRAPVLERSLRAMDLLHDARDLGPLGNAARGLGQALELGQPPAVPAHALVMIAPALRVRVAPSPAGAPQDLGPARAEKRLAGARRRRLEAHLGHAERAQPLGQARMGIDEIRGALERFALQSA